MTEIEPTSSLAAACVERIRDAESQPRTSILALSARDGRLLRRVPAAEQLANDRAAEALARAFDTQPLWRDVVLLNGTYSAHKGTLQLWKQPLFVHVAVEGLPCSCMSSQLINSLDADLVASTAKDVQVLPN
jgi:hypothetical protein